MSGFIIRAGKGALGTAGAEPGNNPDQKRVEGGRQRI